MEGRIPCCFELGSSQLYPASIKTLFLTLYPDFKKTEARFFVAEFVKAFDRALRCLAHQETSTSMT